MKIFCVTGAPSSDLEMVCGILAEAGIDKPKPSRRDENLTIYDWHERVLAAADAPSAPVVQQLGRLWEQLAGSIFLENITTPFWAWADANSTWLLDFWREFEPNLHFVLVYSPPQRALSTALSQGITGGVELDAFMSTWQQYHEEILRFHLRHPQRTLLVDAGQCATNPAAFVQACIDQWKLKLSPAQSMVPRHTIHNPLASFLVEQLRQTLPQMQALQNEMDASLRIIESNPIPKQNLTLALASYCQTQRELSRLPALDSELAQSNTQNKQMVDRIQLLEEQLQTSQHSFTRVKQEYETLASQQRATLTQLNEAQGERQRLQLCFAELQLNEASLAEKFRELSSKNALLQQEFENKQHEMVQMENILQKQQGNQLEREQFNKELSSTNSALREAQQENQLLLLQLHQVQGELERYFFLSQTADKNLQDLQKRWNRMLQRFPDFCDYSDVKIQATTEDAKRFTWTVSKLNAAGRNNAELSFDTSLTDETLTVIINKNNSPLLRWPATEKVEIAFNADNMLVDEDISTTLACFASSDLALLKVIPQVIEEATRSQQLPDGIDQNELQEAVRLWRAALTEIPQGLRFDQLRLKREQVNPDYEHLWLELDNFHFGANSYNKFAFRLSCANVRPKKFGTHPKLEFPADGGRAPFEKWYDESFDDFGEKLELRFALPDAMDLAVWEAISELDRSLVQALLEHLPMMLTLLEEDSNCVTHRTWQDWQKLVCSMQNILRDRTQSVIAAPTTANKHEASAESSVEAIQ